MPMNITSRVTIKLRVKVIKRSLKWEEVLLVL